MYFICFPLVGWGYLHSLSSPDLRGRYILAGLRLSVPGLYREFPNLYLHVSWEERPLLVSICIGHNIVLSSDVHTWLRHVCYQSAVQSVLIVLR